MSLDWSSALPGISGVAWLAEARARRRVFFGSTAAGLQAGSWQATLTPESRARPLDQGPRGRLLTAACPLTARAAILIA